MKPSLYSKTVIAIVALGIGILIGRAMLPHSAATPRAVREPESGYSFISPLLYISTPEETSLPEYGPFKKDASSIVSRELASGSMKRMSVYFRDLSSNDWFGINQNESYSPASLFKVATLMTFLKMAEADPNLLTAKIVIAPSSQDLNSMSYQYFPPAHPLKTGETYAAQDLLSRMIVESDNNAAGALQALIGSARLAKTYKDLGLITASSTPEDVTVTPAEYSRIFRVLYNGTYLSHALSEQTLSLLSHTTFTGGLVAGVPEGTVASHKFGEWTYAAEGTTTAAAPRDFRELHDCGIIYYPEHPYFLCVMTEGSASFPDLEKAISDVSSTIWSDMTRLYQR
jgi:hypothetical protein